MTVRCPVACIVPPELLKRIALEGGAEERRSAIETITLDSSIRQARAEISARRPPEHRALGSLLTATGELNRVVHDLAHATSGLGTVARAEGQRKSKDPSVNEAYDGLGATYTLYSDAFNRNSIDGAGMALHAFVHFGTNYNNAFWDGQQMLFGDGDGSLFVSFTKSLDVIGHELTHGVVQYEANLIYSGQSGALNESMADVFGSLVKQHAKKQTAAQADWLIGADCVGPQLQVALRSMKAPGTANQYDNQPSTMDDYARTSDDNGGVHQNSGIPNHAFYLAATRIGGNAWEAAGRIWYDALRDPRIRPNSGFRSFANATVRQASSLYGATSAEVTAVSDAWKAVKVLS
jgi:Zn-dependent metalloprotease